ncbi:hypothetical protein TVNIR_0203 [Thioalkalivibrio nitratireducens DSM 14787]|uniref:Uncharacterized protein n=1 Tax=Thioalkalivibrio nitratireducens (strain DSM 14787 / UNIQEM 213 / ALEN2) TaxID=1255043 RepID=L0DQU4_THIND|nr:hypothetical protein [Thioalkalivibrio nitratireducens]AGA31914.1 hypothetical protein TVNIR_0203 [Thioalkalivibrio nitratireducens DSM 14787]
MHTTRFQQHNVGIPVTRVTGTEMLPAVDDVGASARSACRSGMFEWQLVLRTLRVPPHIEQPALRFSHGRETKDDGITESTQLLVRAPRIRRCAPRPPDRPGRKTVRR